MKSAGFYSGMSELTMKNSLECDGPTSVSYIETSQYSQVVDITKRRRAVAVQGVVALQGVLSFLCSSRKMLKV
ncbi:MAG: hypothetical protein C5B55_02905 [Blastocatellia bacterium]|nr:MAG: hypothetical protein C5B55_02905 [Blastocatellia bacterium]